MNETNSPDELVTIYEAPNLAAARIVAANLEDEGIAHRLNDENQGGFPGMTAIEGVEIMVKAEDADRARTIIEKHEPREVNDER